MNQHVPYDPMLPSREGWFPPMASADYVEELALIQMSRLQRAGISPDEADAICPVGAEIIKLERKS